jgi:hypothetical protein
MGKADHTTGDVEPDTSRKHGSGTVGTESSNWFQHVQSSTVLSLCVHPGCEHWADLLDHHLILLVLVLLAHPLQGTYHSIDATRRFLTFSTVPQARRPPTTQVLAARLVEMVRDDFSLLHAVSRILFYLTGFPNELLRRSTEYWRSYAGHIHCGWVQERCCLGPRDLPCLLDAQFLRNDRVGSCLRERGHDSWTAMVCTSLDNDQKICS